MIADGGRLVVFDIDGTLTRTAEVDEMLYAEAIRREWGIEGISTDWGAYEHSTDDAIAAQVYRESRGSEPSREDLARLRDRFAALIESEASARPERFAAVPGAAAILAALPSLGWRVAIASGGWTPSARTKLRAAGLACTDLPAAFGCDARARREIIRIAAQRAAEGDGRVWARAVYVGDGRWDLAAARDLGIGFVGVGADERAAALVAAGARAVVPDFTRPERFVSDLERAATGPLA